MAQQAQVDNLVTLTKQQLVQFLATAVHLQAISDMYTAVKTADPDIFIDNPPAGENSNVNDANLANIVAHINAVLADIDGRKAAFSEIIDTVPF